METRIKQSVFHLSAFFKMTGKIKIKNRTTTAFILAYFFLTLLILASIIFVITRANSDKIDIITELTSCDKEKQNCQSSVAKRLMDRFTLEQIFLALEENKSDPEINNICHGITHYLGAIEYQRTKDIPHVYNSCKHVCYEGCFHGATEAYFMDKKIPLLDVNDKDLLKEIPNVCGRRERHESVDFYASCLHGLGHAIMFALLNELPQALKVCDVLSTEEERNGCYGGVFMENTQAEYNKDHPSSYIDSENLLFPCSILEEKYLEICYRYQASHIIRRQSTLYPDFNLVIRFCNSIPEDYHAACINHGSGHMTGYPLDAEGLKDMCNLILAEEDKKECIKGVTSRLLQQNLGKTMNSERFCEALDNPYRDFCGQYLKQRIGQRERG